MTPLEQLAAAGVTATRPRDALAVVLALLPEREDLIALCVADGAVRPARKEGEAMADQHDEAAPVRAHEFLWFDVETTGLDPMTGVMLEFAAVLCEDARGDDFTEVAAYTGVLHYPRHSIEECKPDDFVRTMHKRNGLWAAVEASTTGVIDADRFLAELAASLSGGRKRSIVLAGNSPHFDQAWARVHLPRFAAFLSHRVFDVSTLQRTVDAWAPPGAVVWPKAEAHRALDDVRESIVRTRLARRAMGWAP